MGTADLHRPLDYEEWSGAMQGEEPIAIARHCARNAGGTWIALAPRPLELVNWHLKPQEVPSLTVEGALQAIAKGRTPLSWEARPGYTLLFFGSKEEMARLRAEPPTELVGLFVASEHGAAMVHALEDALQVKIRAQPAVFAAREAVAAARQRLSRSGQEDEAALAYARMGLTRPGAEASDRLPLLEVKADDRTDLDDFVARLAGFFGAEARKSDAGGWELVPLAEPHKIAQEIGRLQDIIKEKAGTGTEGFTSFASRSGGEGYGEGSGGAGAAEEATDESDESDETGDPREVLTSPGPEVDEAFDGLALLGPQAVPTLNGYLDPARGPLAQAAMLALFQMDRPEARRALAEFSQRLAAPQPGKARRTARLLRRSLLHFAGLRPEAETSQLLVEAVQDPDLPEGDRTAARLALLEAGRFEAVAADPARREISAGELELPLRPLASLPGGAPPTPAPKAKQGLVPLATTRLPNGDTWAVFVSGRLGRPGDVWLARAARGQWAEVLFTGEDFPRDEAFGVAAPIKPGGCLISVADDQVTVKPPNQSLAGERARLEKLLQGGQFTDQKKMQELYREYQKVQAQVQGKMAKPLTFSLAELRKDADGDGLSDRVEKRMALDPAKTDTDGDGTPDARDANPGARPAVRSDRTELLQALFMALYGGDPARDLIVVLLEPGQWQEFAGARGRVLCLSRDELKQRADELAGLRMLQFGGPQEPSSTILQQDGPCCFDSGRRSAEVHFWQWTAPGSGVSLRYGNDTSGQPEDYVARFERRGGWKLTSVRPWKWLTAEKAFQQRQIDEATRRGMGGGMGRR